MSYPIKSIREDFPILSTKVGDHDLIYLDNAASTQKPKAVIDAMTTYYEKYHANVHRGLHYLSEKATEIYEGGRLRIGRFLNAKTSNNIVFVKGTTEAINLVANGLSQCHFAPGGKILISDMEHHANIVPWVLLCERFGLELLSIPLLENGDLDQVAYRRLLENNVIQLVSIVHVSNVLGTVNPIADMIKQAHLFDIPVFIDGAQAVMHGPVDVQALDCDFYAFSSHKLYGPTGVGVLYAKSSWLEAMPPYQGGGDMIETVSLNKVTYKQPPYKFEAGTPPIASIAGLVAALDYLESLTFSKIHAYESDLLIYAELQLANLLKDIKIIGQAKVKAPVISFVWDHIHPHDIATILNARGIAIRAGHHCAMPLMHRLGLSATSRVSFSLYNTKEEIDLWIEGLLMAQSLLGKK